MKQVYCSYLTSALLLFSAIMSEQSNRNGRTPCCYLTYLNITYGRVGRTIEQFKNFHVPQKAGIATEVQKYINHKYFIFVFFLISCREGDYKMPRMCACIGGNVRACVTQFSSNVKISTKYVVIILVSVTCS